MTRGQKIVVRVARIEGRDGCPERMAAALVRRVDQEGGIWFAGHFMSCENRSKCRRILVEADGRTWLLLDDDMKAVSTRNKYALYLDRLIKEMAARETSP